ncbi:MAG: glycosyltransferase [Candidatus Krumholzibacteriia bacterium]
MPLAVAQLVETLEFGGAEQLAVRIANARALAGDRALLYVLGEAQGPLASRVDAAVAVRRLGIARAPVRSLGPFTASIVAGYRRLAQQLRQDGVDVLQTHLPGANFWGLLVAERRVCAVAATVHNTREFDYGQQDHPVRRRLRRLAYRRILRRCDATIAVSGEVRDALLAELGLQATAARRLEVVENAVALPALPDPSRRERIRQRIGIPPGVPFLLAAGRLTAQKDFAALVASAAGLARSGRRFRLVIAGEGELRGDLERRVQELGLADVVTLPGNLGDLDQQMLAADVFVLSSRWEGLPLVLLEAMASGLPVVCTRIAGVGDLVEEGGAGLVVPPGDAAALAAAIGSLLDDPGQRQLHGAGARRTVERRFSFERLDQRLGTIYAELAAARVRRAC